MKMSTMSLQPSSKSLKHIIDKGENVVINFFVLYKRRSLKGRPQGAPLHVGATARGAPTIKTLVTKLVFLRLLWQYAFAFAVDLLTVIVGIEGAIVIGFTNATLPPDQMRGMLLAAPHLWD